MTSGPGGRHRCRCVVLRPPQPVQRRQSDPTRRPGQYTSSRRGCPPRPALFASLEQRAGNQFKHFSGLFR